MIDLEAGVERDPSGEITAVRFWRAGRNDTDHGSLLFDSKAARDVIADFQKRGNRLSWDYDHLSLDPNATPSARKSAGTFDLAVRNGELWAVSIRWTDEAKRYLREGEYPSVSPAYDVDTKTNRPLKMINAAICSSPATHNATRLAASVSGSARLSNLERSNEEQLDRDEVIAFLRDVASDPKREPQDRERAEEMLRKLSRKSAKASAALARVQGRKRMQTAIGITSCGGPVRSGTRQTFHTMTPADARAWLARRAPG